MEVDEHAAGGEVADGGVAREGRAPAAQPGVELAAEGGDLRGVDGRDRRAGVGPEEVVDVAQDDEERDLRRHALVVFGGGGRGEELVQALHGDVVADHGRAAVEDREVRVGDVGDVPEADEVEGVGGGGGGGAGGVEGPELRAEVDLGGAPHGDAGEHPGHVAQPVGADG